MKYSLLLLLGFLNITIFGQTKYKKVKLPEGISISIPASFVEMREEVVAIKYTTGRKPTKIFTDDGMEVDLDINITRNFWGGNDLNLLKDFYKSSIINAHKKVTFLQDTVEEVNKRQFVKLEYKSSYGVSGKRRYVGRHYTLILFTLVQNRIIVTSFRCEERRMEKWQKIAQKTLGSIKMKNVLNFEQQKDIVAQKREGQKEKIVGEEVVRPNQKVNQRPDFKKKEVDPDGRKKKENFKTQ